MIEAVNPIIANLSRSGGMITSREMGGTLRWGEKPHPAFAGETSLGKWRGFEL